MDINLAAAVRVEATGYQSLEFERFRMHARSPIVERPAALTPSGMGRNRSDARQSHTAPLI